MNKPVMAKEQIDRFRDEVKHHIKNASEAPTEKPAQDSAWLGNHYFAVNVWSNAVNKKRLDRLRDDPGHAANDDDGGKA